MATTVSSASVFNRLRYALTGDGGSLSDADLLDTFALRGDESAFAALVRRHGNMVFGVCRRVTQHCQDAEDAFQATFVVLARKASTLGRCERLAGWLYGVAYRTAMKARTMALKRRSREHPLEDLAASEGEAKGENAELIALLDGELQRLPHKYRVPLVLCALEGRSRAEAARQLALPEGTLSSRLAAGRKMLAQRLARRGVLAMGVALPMFLPEAASASVSSSLVLSTTQTAISATLTAPVATLTQGVLHAMLLAKIKLTAAVLFAVAVAGTGTGLLLNSSSAFADEERKVEKKEEKKGERVDRGRAGRPVGKVELVDPTTNTIAVTFQQEGKEPVREVFTVHDQAIITIEGKRSKLTDLKEGQPVYLRIGEDGKTVGAITVAGKELNATIKSVSPDGKTINLANLEREGGPETALPLATDVQVTMGREKVAPRDIRSGSKATLNFSLDGKTVVAVNINPRDGEGRREGDGRREGERGRGLENLLIESIDAEKGTITLVRRTDLGDAKKVLTVDPKADILIGEQASKLTDLKAGQVVNVFLDKDEKSVTRIALNIRPINGKVKEVNAEKKTITLSGERESRTFTLSDEVRVRVAGRPGTLAEIKPGSGVRLFMAPDGKTVQSMMVFIGDRDGEGGPRKDGEKKEGEKRDEK